MELKGFYNEEILAELHYKDEITWLQHVWHHSEERRNDFIRYCKRRNLPENDETAEQYMNYILKREENEHTDLLD